MSIELRCALCCGQLRKCGVGRHHQAALARPGGWEQEETSLSSSSATAARLWDKQSSQNADCNTKHYIHCIDKVGV